MKNNKRGIILTLTLKVASDTSATSSCCALKLHNLPKCCLRVIYLSSWFNWSPYLIGLLPSSLITEKEIMKSQT